MSPEAFWGRLRRRAARGGARARMAVGPRTDARCATGPPASVPVEHDVWVCPEGEHLWPHEFDHERRLVRYRARAHVCNGCPVKERCTDSDRGREVVRPLDPWPHSEAGRFHRVIALMLVALAGLVLVAALARNHAPTEAAVLAGLLAVSALIWHLLLQTCAPGPRTSPSPPLPRPAHAGLDGRRAARGRRRARAGSRVQHQDPAEHERAVVFRLGRLLPPRGPGPILLVAVRGSHGPGRPATITLTIPPQEVITRDNVPARVAAVCYFRVTDLRRVTEIEAFAPATSQIAQTTLRSVLGRAELDHLLAEQAPQRRPQAHHR